MTCLTTSNNSTHWMVNQEFSSPEINPRVLQNSTSRTFLKIISVLNITRSFKVCHNREIRTVLPVSIPSMGTQTMCDVIVGERTGHVSSVVDSTLGRIVQIMILHTKPIIVRRGIKLTSLNEIGVTTRQKNLVPH